MSCITRVCYHWLNVRHATITALLALGTIVGTSHGAVVDFEDLGQGPNVYESSPGTIGGYYWNGPADASGTFTSNGVQFNNSNSAGWWSGWAYSNVNDTTKVGSANQYAAYTGTGVGGSGNYAVGYVGNPNYGDVVPTITIPLGMKVDSAMFTNSTYAALSMANGDDFAKKFGHTWNSTTESWDDTNDADWFKLTVCGKDATGTLLPNTVEFYLADYRNLDGSPDYILNSWQSVDLSSLSAARTLQFGVSSSDNSTYSGTSYMNTPAYFVMDNLTLTHAPEPSTLALIIAGGLAALAWRWRRRKS